MWGRNGIGVMSLGRWPPVYSFPARLTAQSPRHPPSQTHKLLRNFPTTELSKVSVFVSFLRALSASCFRFHGENLDVSKWRLGKASCLHFSKKPEKVETKVAAHRNSRIICGNLKRLWKKRKRVAAEAKYLEKIKSANKFLKNLFLFNYKVIPHS